MATREYIGARYVPEFGRHGEESIAWDNSAPYEPLTIVLYQGNSYTSRQYVPAGVAITNEEYWAQTGNYNAQVEAYRSEVQTFDGRITANASDIDALQEDVSALQDDVVDLHKPNCILIGDSYLRTYGSGETANPGWGDYFIAQTGFNELARYKAGGAGWVRPGDLPGHEPEAGLNFNGMLSKAHSEFTGDAALAVDYIVVNGLVNDIQTGVTPGDIQAAIRTFCTNARTYFPNAKICISFAMCTENICFDHDISLLIKGLPRIIPSGVQYAKYSPWWFIWCHDTLGRGDGIHPNTEGYEYLGKFMAEFVMGNDAFSAQTSGDILHSLGPTQLANWINSNWNENYSTIFGTSGTTLMNINGNFEAAPEIKILLRPTQTLPSDWAANGIVLPIPVYYSWHNMDVYYNIGGKFYKIEFPGEKTYQDVQLATYINARLLYVPFDKTVNIDGVETGLSAGDSIYIYPNNINPLEVG